MSKALELIETWEETLDFGSDRKMWAHVDLMVDELRRLAEIERKYNEIMAQLPVVYLTNGSNGGWEIWDSDSSDIEPMPVYTLPKD